jgi:hypothetical protein
VRAEVHVAKAPDPHPAEPPRPAQDQVDARAPRAALGVTGAVLLARAHESRALGVGDGVLERARVAAGLHLAEGQHPSALRDEVDLSGGAPPAPREDAPPAPSEEGRRRVLPAVAQVGHGDSVAGAV